MNIHFKKRFAVMLALAAILLQTFTLAVSAASTVQTCAGVIEQAAATTAAIDIPARRAEYAALDRIGECQVISGMEISVPVTGRSGTVDDRFMEMKDRQAEMQDASLYTAPSNDIAGYRNPRFMDFKQRQAECVMFGGIQSQFKGSGC